MSTMSRMHASDASVIIIQLANEQKGWTGLKLDHDLRDVLLCDQVTNERQIALGMDSLDIVELSMELELIYGIHLPHNEPWHTLADINEAVKQALRLKNSL